MPNNRVSTPKKCAKCRDVKKWSPAEEFKGTFWHWRRHGEYLTALAKRCMVKR